MNQRYTLPKWTIGIAARVFIHFEYLSVCVCEWVNMYAGFDEQFDRQQSLSNYERIVFAAYWELFDAKN